jgi:hypothetical protein
MGSMLIDQQEARHCEKEDERNAPARSPEATFRRLPLMLRMIVVDHAALLRAFR